MDDREDARLLGVYDKLRARLLDLTKRNRMLNHAMGPRARRQVQFVGTDLQTAYDAIVADKAAVAVAPLDEPDTVPADERTAEFADALAQARVSDIEYLVAREGLTATANDGDPAVERLERLLRDRLRERLGMSPRQARLDVGRVEHARALGIDPEAEFKRAADRPPRVGPLQTLRYPDELEATMDKLLDEARLAEQESGLSTLFLAFGFLEWYESETSDKPHYAPLLMLPVRIVRRSSRGRTHHDLVASEPTAEHNVSLLKFLEVEHGRTLPPFLPGESDAPPSVDAYLDAVRTCLDGLERWCVRRFAVLGHFAFSRIAIYEDTAPERWALPILDNPLLRTLLAGYEVEGELGAGFHAAEDYRIDDPVVENAAPILIHDADASQHSAMVDVMNGRNLVIQGPPGTGKSQTIVNIVANALAAGRSVLFVSQKQAALEVVKRRLDSAGLGDFCLELHSEKSSAKAVVGSLRDRHHLGAERSTATLHRSDAAWSTTRSQIVEYLDALHAPTADGESPYDLIWRSIRGCAAHADILAMIGPLELSSSLFRDATTLEAARDGLELYALEAQGFADAFGHVGRSPWTRTPPKDALQQDRSAVFAAIAAACGASRDLAAIQALFQADGVADVDAVAAFATIDQALGEAPSTAAVAAISALEPDDLDRALTLQDAVIEAGSALKDLPTPPEQVAAALHLAVRLAAVLPAELPATLAPEAIYNRAEREAEARRSRLTAAQALRPALDLLGITDAESAEALGSLAKAIIEIASIDESTLAWIALDIDETFLDDARRRWRALHEENAALEGDFGISPELPTAAELEMAAGTIGKTGPSRVLSRIRGDSKVAKAVAVRAGLPFAAESAAAMLRLARHMRSVSAFDADATLASALGSGWARSATPFDDVERGRGSRSRVLEQTRAHPGGGNVARALSEASRSKWGALATHLSAADDYAATIEACGSLGPSLSIARQAQRDTSEADIFEQLLTVDPKRILAATSLDLRTLVDVARARDLLSKTETALAGSPLRHAMRFLAATREALASTRSAAAWLSAVNDLALPPAIAEGLRHDPPTWRARARETTASWANATAMFQGAMATLRSRLDGIDALREADLLNHLASLAARRDEFTDYASLAQARRSLYALGLGGFLDRTDAAFVPPSQLPELFDAMLARRRAEAALLASPALAQGGTKMDVRRKFFAERDKARILSDRQTVRRRLLERRPENGMRTGPKKSWTEMSLLAEEFAKDGRFTPVRGLLHRAGRSVRALKPCFMMSPLSLAKFLTPDSEPFDLLIIDEASQMRPEDALGAMLRARRMVVVGDPKQLPPTAFFSRAVEEGDDDEEEDVDDESILERCQKAFGQVRRLKWHYRSRCESLIRFSNENFYENGLVTFPASAPGSFSIDLVRVEGSYQARRNVAEAERVAEEAIGLMRHLAGEPEGCVPSLGIVAVNMAQRDLIQDTLRRLSVGDERVAEYTEKVERQGEPPFVKNLENVQGDERDYVFISLTYGRTPGASVVVQRFGPINSKQGHRRLNVLFSRARRRIALFTSMASSDIVPSESSQEGVRILKRYLEYAEGAGKAPVERIGGVADSDFEIEVAERLASRGYTVDLQVGVSGFRIDLGVRHPEHPEVFLAGVECDGATYHSSKSARDRDRLREEVLRGLGWDLLRVWSTDWFDDPDAQTRRLVEKLEELRTKPIRLNEVYTVGAAFSGSGESDLSAADGVPPLDVSDHAVKHMMKIGKQRGYVTYAELNAVLPSHEIEAKQIEEILAWLSSAGIEAVESADGREDDEGADGGTPEPLAQHDDTLFEGEDPLDEAGAVEALVAYRETVIRPGAAEWEPQRSILRDGLIETFVKQRLTDPSDWHKRVPQFQRAGTDPKEKREHLERICAVVGRIADTEVTSRIPRNMPIYKAASDLIVADPVHVVLDFRPTHLVPPPSGSYARAELDASGLNRDAFYEASYRPTLRRLVGIVIEAEAPIYADVLATRIARAHGMERTGNVIRKIVVDAIDYLPVSIEEGREVVWTPSSRTDVPVRFREAAEHVRSHGDVPIAELASLATPYLRQALSDDTIVRKMAERLRLGRVRATVRNRLLAALEFARTSAAHVPSATSQSFVEANYAPDGSARPPELRQVAEDRATIGDG